MKKESDHPALRKVSKYFVEKKTSPMDLFELNITKRGGNDTPYKYNLNSLVLVNY
jgi:hypothetical protein